MSDSATSEDESYDDSYDDFESPLMGQLGLEAYGIDMGQPSWGTVKELREDIPRLELSPASRLLDLGCGPCGPLAFIVGLVRCQGIGMDVSAKAMTAARTRAASLGIDDLLELHEADMNEAMPFQSGSFDVVMSLDAILHLRDRLAVFREVARVLRPRGKLYFTDAGVITGPISNEEIRLRAAHGYTQFTPSGSNERTLERAGFQLIDRNDRTSSLLENATGRLAARLAPPEGAQHGEGKTPLKRRACARVTIRKDRHQTGG